MSEPRGVAPHPAAVIFDLDGTLVDTVVTRIAAWLRVFAEEGIPAGREQVAALIGSDGKVLTREVAEAAGMTLEPKRLEAIDVRCGEIFEDLNRRPHALPGVDDALQRLDRAGIPWAIATSSRREQVATSVAALRLPKPPTIVDGTHVEHAKPAPDLLLRAAEALRQDPGSCWYVGDSTWDMRASVAAGMTAIGVTSGAVDAETLRDAGASRVVPSLAELEI